MLLSLACGLLLLAVSCGVERYPLVILHGRTYLETQDQTGRLVRFAVDTGSDRSLLSRSWVEQIGAHVLPGPPGSWGGVRLSTRWRSVARGVPDLPGVPRFLEGLPAADDGPLSPLAGPVPTVGLLGTDLLWDWAVDFRGDIPWLIHGTPDEAARDRIKVTLFQDGGRYTAGLFAQVDQAVPLSGRAVVDTGSPFSLLAFQRDPPYGVETFTNPRSPVTANGTTTRFIGLDEVHIGKARLGPVVGLAGELNTPGVLLLGTPSLRALGAVVDLKAWALTVNPVASPVPATGDAPEAWGWSATVVPPRGIRLDHVALGSVLWTRGLRSGDWVTRLGNEAASAPRSSLEWRRTWIRLGLGQF